MINRMQGGMAAATQNLTAYAAIFLTIAVLDAVWLGLIATGWYQQALGHLMAARPRWGAALAFYLVYAAGILVFVVIAQKDSAAWQTVLVYGAFFGLVAYATYGLSNLATLRDWPVAITVLDMAWGSTISAIAALAGWSAYRIGPA